MVEKMEKAVRTAARAILPVWKTTTIPILHRESGLLPAYQMLEHIRRRYAATGPGRGSPARVPTLTTHATQLRQRKGPKTYTTTTSMDSPPDRREATAANQGRTTVGTARNRDEGGRSQSLRGVSPHSPPTGFLSYTDGSLLDNGVAGWSLSIRHSLRIFPKLRVCGRLDRVEVFDAEAYGALPIWAPDLSGAQS